jgi:hypothetical protein
MPRDPRVEKFARLHRARWTRPAGHVYGTQATAYGDVRTGSRQRDAGRIGLALVLLVGVAGVLLHVLGQVEVAPWLHMVLHTVGLDQGGPLPAHLH